MNDIPTEHLNYRITAARFDQQLDPDEGPASFVTLMAFELRQADLMVAQVHALRINVTLAEEKGYPLAEVFDTVDQDLHELYCAIYDEKTEAIRDDLAEGALGRDVLHIETVKVIPSRRGQRLGLRFVERLRDLFGGGCAVLTLQAFPLSYEHSKHPDKIDREVFSKGFSASGDEAKAKLRAYWSQLGLKRVGQTDYMLFDLSERPPTLAR